jgi:hypothetical protein
VKEPATPFTRGGTTQRRSRLSRTSVGRPDRSGKPSPCAGSTAVCRRHVRRHHRDGNG